MKDQDLNKNSEKPNFLGFVTTTFFCHMPRAANQPMIFTPT
jgi:hypothetical protein